MARPCATCNHPKRALIERKLLEGMSIRSVATMFHISRESLSRHLKGRHIQKSTLKRVATKQVAEIAELEAASHNALVQQASQLYGRACNLLDDAEEAGSLHERAAAIRECRGIIDTLAKLVSLAADAKKEAVSLAPELDDRISEALEARWAEALEQPQPIRQANWDTVPRHDDIPSGPPGPTAPSGTALEDGDQLD